MRGMFLFWGGILAFNSLGHPKVLKIFFTSQEGNEKNNLGKIRYLDFQLKLSLKFSHFCGQLGFLFQQIFDFRRRVRSLQLIAKIYALKCSRWFIFILFPPKYNQSSNSKSYDPNVDPCREGARGNLLGWWEDPVSWSGWCLHLHYAVKICAIYCKLYPIKQCKR